LTFVLFSAIFAEMIIKKELKNATFEYDEEKKCFYIGSKEGERIELNKVYAFAFMRFVVRMAQRNWLRQLKKTDKNFNKTTEDILQSEDIDHPDQVTFL
jgi:hypothetical protein